MMIAVIGATGFLGSKLLQELSRHTVMGTFFSKRTEDGFFLDLRRRESVKRFFNAFEPELIIHCAGDTKPDSCENDHRNAFLTNLLGTEYLLQFSNAKILYFSTDYVFDGSKESYTEFDEPNPINYYGWTKLESEKRILSRSSGNVILRVAGLYGINPQNNEFLKSLDRPIIYKAIDCYSSHILIDDICQNIEYFFNKSGVFHLSDGGKLSRFAFALKAVNSLGLNTQVVGKPITELPLIAKRPRDTTLLSLRHHLMIRNTDEGLAYSSLNSSKVINNV